MEEGLKDNEEGCIVRVAEVTPEVEVIELEPEPGKPWLLREGRNSHQIIVTSSLTYYALGSLIPSLYFLSIITRNIFFLSSSVLSPHVT